MKRIKIIYLLVFFSTMAFSQQKKIKPAIWKLLSMEGNIGINGQYNDTFGSSLSKQSRVMYGGEVFLSSESYVWHPNFLTLLVSGGYQPQLGETTSSLMPDYFSNYSNKQYAVNARFLSSLKYNLTTYMSYNYQKGEDLFYDTDIENNKWGATFYYNDKFKLMSTFEQSSDNRFDNLTNRNLLLKVNNLTGNVAKSFSRYDENEFNYNIQDINTKQTNIFENANKIKYFSYRNMLFFNKLKDISLTSLVSISDSKGSSNYKNFGFQESFSTPILKRLSFRANYAQTKTERDFQTSREIRTEGSLTHSLYNSLITELSISKNSLALTESYKLENNIAIFRTSYSKKIPILKGNLMVNYSIRNLNQIRNSSAQFAVFFDEKHRIIDGSIALLKNPYILLETIAVTDISNSIIYQKNIDYLLIERGSLVEIVRLVGGAIDNNSEVFIDYETSKNESYDYKANEKDFDVRLDMLNRFLTLNFNKSTRNFLALSGNKENLNFDEFNKYKYGFNLQYKIYTAGTYYEENESNFFPYKLLSFNFGAAGSISNKMNLKINGMINNYSLYFKEGNTSYHTLITTDIDYKLNYITKLTLNLSYNNQQGDVQDFRLITGRTELNTRLNQLELVVGVNYYNRSVSSYDFTQHYLGAQIKLKRNF